MVHVVTELIFVQGGFLSSGDMIFFESGVEVTRDKREVNNVGDRGNKDGCTFFKMLIGDRIRIGMFVLTVRCNLVDFRFRSRGERGKNLEV